MDSDETEVDRARAYITTVMAATKRDPTNLARLARINPSTLTRLMSPTPRGGIRRSTLKQIADASGVPLPTNLLPDLPHALGAVAAGALVRDVPVHGLIGTRWPDRFYWNQTPLDLALRPPGVLRATRLFGLRMPDDSMAGWRMPGEMIYVDPMRPVAEGDHAFIEVANATAPDDHSHYMIRRVVRRRPSGVVLQTWGFDPQETTLEHGDALSFHRILEWSELLGS